MKTIGLLGFVDASMGGILLYTKSLMNALSLDEAHRCVLFVPQGSPDFDDARMEVRTIAESERGSLAQAARLALIASNQRRAALVPERERAQFADVDLFITPTTSFFPHFFLGKPYIYVLHDLQERHYPEFFPLARRVARRVLRDRCARNAAHILCESRFVRDDIVRFLGVDSDRISVIESPPPRAFLDARPSGDELAHVRRKYALPESYLFYPAQFWRHKNHGVLLDALAMLAPRHTDLHLVLTGAPTNEFRSVLAKVHELGLSDRVAFLGHVDYDDLPSLYTMSRMLVMPTLFESVSIPVYEAFSLGVPVVCSNVVALPEQVGDAGLIFDAHDASRLAREIERVLTNSQLAQELGEKGLGRIRGFDHASYSRKLRDLIEAVLHAGAS